MYITRRARFSASHRLMKKGISPEENKKLFGKCYNPHGHNYELFVTITGKIDKKSGMIVDLKDLKKIIHDKIIEKIDHNSLNKVKFMQNIIPTTENLCIQIWKEIENPIKELGGELYKIRITETENNYFEYFGKK